MKKENDEIIFEYGDNEIFKEFIKEKHNRTVYFKDNWDFGRIEVMEKNQIIYHLMSL